MADTDAVPQVQDAGEDNRSADLAKSRIEAGQAGKNHNPLPTKKAAPSSGPVVGGAVASSPLKSTPSFVPNQDTPVMHKGGVVPGKKGADVPIIAQAGEVVVPAGRASEYRQVYDKRKRGKSNG